MADIDYEVGIAVGVQASYSAINSTLEGMNSGEVDEDDGAIYGDPQSGEYKSGITMPAFARVSTPRAPIMNSYTMQPDMFIKNEWSGLQIAFPLSGTGNTVTTPATDEAKPDIGIDALLQGCGLSGASGTDPEYVYTPLGSTKYLTVSLWEGEHNYVFGGCVVETLSMPFVAGQSSVATASIRIGWLETYRDSHSVTGWAYGNNDNVNPPRAINSGFIWGQTRGFETLQLDIVNTIEKAGDSNNDDQGERIFQSAQEFKLSGKLYVSSSDSDFVYQQALLEIAPTDDASWRVGTAAGASDTARGLNFEVNNLQVDSWTPSSAAEVMSVQFAAHATGPSANSEFTMTFD